MATGSLYGWLKNVVRSYCTNDLPGGHSRGIWIVLPATLLLISASSVAVASDLVDYGYRDFSFPNNTAGNSKPTSEKPESKLWWHDGYWWASMWSREGNAYHIYRLDLATQDWEDTGTALDDRSASRADALADGDRLYVVSHLWDNDGGEAAPAGQRGELYRYSYDSTADSYTLDADFPVEVNGGKTETLVLEKASNGQLWVTYVQDNQVMVNRSVNGDTQWGQPFVLPFDEAQVRSDDISSIISYDDHVGIMWSNQFSPKEMYFAVHRVGNQDTDWSKARAYGISGDDHINLKSLEADSEGNVYAVIKTSNDSALIVVLVCERNVFKCSREQDWTPHTVYDATHNPTRPILLIDSSNRELYVFTSNDDESANDAIYYKKTSLDDIQFTANSIGTPFIKSSTETEIDDPTSTKQNLTSTTGLVVLASDSNDDYYLHNYLSLGTSPSQYTLTANALGSGSVTLDPPGNTYDEGTVVALTAAPNVGWTFGGWSGDLTGMDNPATITMDGDKDVTATFTAVPQYSLTVSTVGAGNVTLSPPGGIYSEGTIVSLTATPEAGWTFSGWSGDLSSMDNPATITMDADKSVTATFTATAVPQYRLTVNKVGEGNVTLSPPGGTYDEGTVVSLTATPAVGWIFSGWSGDLIGTDNPATITMDADKGVTAMFTATAVPQYTLTVNKMGEGNVTLSPPGGVYSEGTPVSLTATPAVGWTFSGWSGDVTGATNPVSLTMNSDKTVTATFIQSEPGIQIDVSASTTTATVGQLVTYTYVVANIGESTVDEVTVVDDRFGPVPLDHTSLSSGAIAVGHYVYTVSEADLPGPLLNHVMATGIVEGGQEVSASAGISIAVVSRAYYLPLLFKN